MLYANIKMRCVIQQVFYKQNITIYKFHILQICKFLKIYINQQNAQNSCD